MSTLPPVPAQYTLPAEWSAHRACWVAWPTDASLWLDGLGAAQREFTALCRTITDMGAGGAPAEQLEVLVHDADAERAAQAALDGLGARLHRVPYGDIWLRDTGPMFLKQAAALGIAAHAQAEPARGPASSGTRDSSDRATVRFSFNGWGGKYVLPHDAEVSAAIAHRAELPEFGYPWILEGGAIEVDGEGTLLTTRQCLLNANRNAGTSEAQIERWLGEALGVTRVLWLDEGLLDDHTDGHIDTLARFVRPGVVACMRAAGSDDPNARVMEKIALTLRQMTDAQGRRLEVVDVPSPGRVQDDNGRVMPASYMNYYLGNRTVAVPLYGTAADDLAVRALTPLFPDRRVVGLSAKAILAGGGAFHCITQQEPR